MTTPEAALKIAREALKNIDEVAHRLCAEEICDIVQVAIAAIDALGVAQAPDSFIQHPFAIVVDRQYDGSGTELVYHDGETFVFADGDCCEREGDTLDGYTAEFLTLHELQGRLFAAPSEQPAQPVKAPDKEAFERSASDLAGPFPFDFGVDQFGNYKNKMLFHMFIGWQLSQSPAHPIGDVHDYQRKNPTHYVHESVVRKIISHRNELNIEREMWLAQPASAALSRDEFHDKAWALYHAKTFDDTQLAKVNIHTIRAVFNAVYDAAPLPQGEQCPSVPLEKYQAAMNEIAELRACLDQVVDETSTAPAAPARPIVEIIPDRKVIMKHWDEWRKYIASGGKGSHPRDAFETLLDWYDEQLFELAATAQPVELIDLERQKDAAYLERNQVVAALAKCFHAGIARTAIEGWSEDWHGCVYIDLPTGQVSWHYHDSQAHLFDGLPPYQGNWDGHDTPEKYRRLAALQPVEPVHAGWISVKDRMPELRQPVALVHIDRWRNTGGEWSVNDHACGYLDECGHAYWSCFGESRGMVIDAWTHWMPLPPTPAQTEGSKP